MSPKAVQQVMQNLLISNIELRSEESIDIRPYTHERKVEKIVVPMGEELSEIRTKYIEVSSCLNFCPCLLCHFLFIQGVF